MSSVVRAVLVLQCFDSFGCWAKDRHLACDICSLSIQKNQFLG